MQHHSLHGRLALNTSKKQREIVGTIQVPGCRPFATGLTIKGWNHVALDSAPELAHLTLHVAGDNARRVEAFHIALFEKKKDGGRKLVRSLHMPVHKRIGARLTLRDLPIGEFELRFLPFANPAMADFGTFTQTHVAEETRLAGMQFGRQSSNLNPGGRSFTGQTGTQHLCRWYASRCGSPCEISGSS